MYLSPFDDRDIKKYLNKKFGRFSIFNHNKKVLARKIVEKSPNLMVRPMLLSYIDDLIFDKSDQINDIEYSYVHEIYEALIVKWILREARRMSYAMQDEFVANMYLFSIQIALKIYKNFTEGKGLYINASDILNLSSDFNINLSDMELKGRSLLNRSPDGKFKFAHKSIFEYIIALHAYQDRIVAKISGDQLEVTSPVDFQDLDQAKQFFTDMFISFKQIPIKLDSFVFRRPQDDQIIERIDLISESLIKRYIGYMPKWKNSNTFILEKTN